MMEGCVIAFLGEKRGGLMPGFRKD